MSEDIKSARPRQSETLSATTRNQSSNAVDAGMIRYPRSPVPEASGIDGKHLPPNAIENPPEEYRRFKLARDNDRALEFDGVELAKVVERSRSTKTGAAMVTRAALYRTRGGKFVTEFSKIEAEGLYPNSNAARPVEFAKAKVFDSQDIAMQWFRVGGRFTMKLWEQLGGLESEFIE